MTRVLVTGGAGLIGSNLVNELIKQNYGIFVIDNLCESKRKNVNSKAGFFKLDICNYKSILPVFKDVKYVFHLAALPRVQFSIENPRQTHLVNIDGTLNVLQASREQGVKRIIFSSSSSVYGEQTTLPIKETAHLNPLSPYALHKIIGEQYCKLFSELYNLETICLRYFNVYGNGQTGDSPYATAIAKFLQLKNENKPITIFGDGEQTRDFVNVLDVVSANILAMKNKKIGNGEIINICSGKKHSINQIANLISNNRIYLPAKKGEPKNSIGDNSLAKKLLNWTPKISLEEGIKKLLW